MEETCPECGGAGTYYEIGPNERLYRKSCTMCGGHGVLQASGWSEYYRKRDSDSEPPEDDGPPNLE